MHQKKMALGFGALMKDLTAEAVSGLTILNAVGISGGGRNGGRVQKPIGCIRKPLIGFKLICSFSSIQGLEEYKDQSDFDGDCSLRLPVVPPGCLALGCVAL
ncbi:calcium-dependent lipid-binding family protein [Actinidia rufa]|uniref:Calcium-dependent lipid-binding family protein n=1 Tax=Actinidia rufa TaxID=165716 RepID=A0A7J0GT38_9ERIC|nr:calcium-dependent lipid-binding family protein [Actinidia rufa]